jgi:hypothetical protein
LVCVPLRRSHDTIGVLAVNARRARAFDDADVAVLTRLAGFVSVVIGSACDLDRVGKHLLEIDPSGGPLPADLGAPTSDYAASRYVMSVLSPDTVARGDCGQRLRSILSDTQVLSMVFQPIIDVVKDEVVAVEALARFDVSPYRSPDVWFKEARENGFGVELEMMAVALSLAKLPALPDGVALSINAGPETVTAPEFNEATLGIAAGRVIVELTEHNAIDDYPGLIDSLQTLRRRGSESASMTPAPATPASPTF